MSLSFGKLVRGAGLTGAAAVALLAVNANAADMPVKAPPLAPPAGYDWTGFYVGGHVGYGWADGKTTNINGTRPFPPGEQSTSSEEGVFGGPQLGFNYQFAQHWLIGVEGDYSWSDISGTTSRFSTVPPFTATRFLTTNSKIEWLATLTGRFGYAVDNWLFYGKGGAAWGHFEVNSQTTNPVAGTLQTTVSGGETRTGWTAGGGVEWGFLGNWSARLEYDYIDFGSQTVSRNVTFAATPVPNPLLRTAELHIQQVTFAINYRFGGPGGRPAY